MIDREIIQNSISQLGQSQLDRPAVELRSDFVRLDERTPEQLFGFARRMAEQIVYYRHTPGATRAEAAGNWSAFFARGGASPAELLAATDGTMPAQLALFLAFLRLYDQARAALNTFTDRHLQFYYRDVLRFARRAAAPAHAHVVFELKKHVAPVRLLPSHELSAGKDQVCRPVRETMINAATVDRLQVIRVDGTGPGAICAATLPRPSGDAPGSRAPLDVRFAIFGQTASPTDRIGFAVASPLLRMRDGERTVTLWFETEPVIPSSITAVPGGALQAFVTGSSGWLGPYPVVAAPSVGGTTLSFEVPNAAGAVVDYDASLHGRAFTTTAPVAQILLRPGAAVGYRDLGGIAVMRMHVSVDVQGAIATVLENDAGRLDPKKKLAPFGTQPAVGSCFFIGIPEVLAKPLTELSLAIEWHGLPDDMAEHYAHYDASVSRDLFTASAAYTDSTGRRREVTSLSLFDVEGGSAARLGLWAPMSSVAATPGNLAPGIVTLTLEHDFLHETYRRLLIQYALAPEIGDDGKPVVLKAPYTPTIAGLAIDYKASTGDVIIASTKDADFADAGAQLFHIDAFGERREHGYLRKDLAEVAQRRVPLLPEHPDEGELLIGIAGVAPGNSVSLLVQVADGSADPTVSPPEIAWSVLCDNHWKRLGTEELVLDTTDRLLRSGLVGVVIPQVASTVHSLLPSGRVWLRAAVATDAAATSRLLEVIANAAEVALVDRGGDDPQSGAALPAGRIAKLKTPMPAIKSVRQPYPSFGGRPAESADALVTRASERLRHKARCIAPWDYERVVLEAFPRVHKVKCVPHARRGDWMAPGCVLLVVVPDLRNDNAREPLRPRVDAATLKVITDYAQLRASEQVTVDATNPSYQTVRLDFKVKFCRGCDPGVHVPLLNRELIAFLSPWAFDADRPIAFGGIVYRSVLLDFVERRDYVDYVTDFKLSSDAAPRGEANLSEVQAATPDAILVSDDAHGVVAIGP